MPATSWLPNRPTLVLITGGIVVALAVNLALDVIQQIAAVSSVAIVAATSWAGDRRRRPSERAVSSNARTRGELRRCEQQRAARRRVVQLLTRRTSPERLFAAVTDELEQLPGIG